MTILHFIGCGDIIFVGNAVFILLGVFVNDFYHCSLSFSSSSSSSSCCSFFLLITMIANVALLAVMAIIVAFLLVEERRVAMVGRAVRC